MFYTIFDFVKMFDTKVNLVRVLNSQCNNFRTSVVLVHYVHTFYSSENKHFRPTRTVGIGQFSNRSKVFIIKGDFFCLFTSVQSRINDKNFSTLCKDGKLYEFFLFIISYNIHLRKHKY